MPRPDDCAVPSAPAPLRKPRGKARTLALVPFSDADRYQGSLLMSAGPVGALVTSVGIRIRSEMNQREHWRARMARARLHKDTVFLGLGRRVVLPADGPIEVLLHRLGGRRMDGDNLQAGFKATRDGVALWLGLDDGSERIGWIYGQTPAGASFAHRVEITVLWAVEPDKEAHG